MPQRETTYEYDDGRLVRSSEWVESEWVEQEQGYMLALAVYEAGLCGRCKHPTTEAWADDADYVYDSPIRCHACDAYLRAGVHYKDSPRPQALIHLVHRR